MNREKTIIEWRERETEKGGADRKGNDVTMK